MTNYEELVTKLRDVYRAYVVTGNEKAEQFLADAAAAIEDLQAEVERLEPKHGEWKETDMGWDGDTAWVCSVCGEPWTLIDGTPKENNMNFCPNCGAKMEVQDGQ